ncbi:Cobalt-zinc-cadmium resistance protein CzcB [Stieleria neptunia]|uniref:Cobalt-zinc-cadmium resistance protein CzcB n=1 Tax=Stieleria neptunia TaxID=2527979 RepID=A0A518HNH7_9BACT|nr:HlyD family efflux transporter periplasmic adaptor subunit [Stieleria neptunia]QDV42337.1 Cobalt-zinc-cadmium resistance protein CzcB [Stieleria neptunia]
MRTLIAALVLSATVAIGLASRQAWLQKQQLPAGLIQANGRTEGDHIAIASKFAGRVSEVLAREGDNVAAAATLIQIDDQQLQAKLNQATHGVAVADAILQGARANANAVAAEVRAAKTSLALLKKQVPLAIETAEAELQQALAAGATADSNEGYKRSESQRAQKLLNSKAISVEEADRKELAWTLAQNELTTATAARITAEKRLAESKLGADRIKEREDAVAALEAMHAKSLAQIKECEARQAEAEAGVAEAQSNLDDLTITAPATGTILSRFVDQGEVVNAGTPLLDLVDLDRLYLQVYVPEPLIGRIRLGLSAKVYTDAYPDQPFNATVRYIASEAEFTPKQVQTKDERVKLVYAVRLYFNENPEHRLTPGLPADAIIRWIEETPWTPPRW